MHVVIQVFSAAVMMAALCFGAHADTSTDGHPTNITGRSAVTVISILTAGVGCNRRWFVAS
jgi:hypothetical protein